MTFHALIRELARRKVKLAVFGDRIRVRAPEALPTELLQWMRHYKPALLRLLPKAAAPIPDPFDEPLPVLAAPPCQTGSLDPPACERHAEPILRPTLGGLRAFCQVCGRRIGLDQPYPW